MNRYDVGIVGYWYATNYGSAMTYYALSRAMNQMGFSTVLIESPMKDQDPEGEDVFSRIFLRAHCNISESIPWDKQRALNDLCDGFMVGSDQVWTSFAIRHMRDMFFLGFVDEEKKKVAYAPSFGNADFFQPTPEQEQMVKRCLNRFDRISVREDSGREMVRNRFGIRADQTLDPVFLISQDEYRKISAESQRDVEGKYILAYILDPTPDKEEFIRKTAQKLSMDVKIVLDGRAGTFPKNRAKFQHYSDDVIQKDVDLPDWTKLFQNAAYVVTDSHHGVAMAVIYNKNFLCYPNYSRGYSRFVSLMSLLGLMDRMVPNTNSLTENILLQDVNYEKVNDILKKQKERSLQWLRDAFSLPKNKLPSIRLPENTVALKVDKYLCTGCGVCANVCPVGAITMKPNDEGFMNPVVNNDTCIDCGRCVSKCIALHPQYKNQEKPECHAFWAKDEIRKISSSGGVFTVAAEYILNQGGYVAGAVYRENYSVCHDIISDKAELWRMRGSKYMQSDVGDIYKRVKALLEQDKLVLFTGLPCQVAALYAYLGNKKYDKLYTIDLVCHGITSQKVFDKFHKDVLHGKKMTDLQFKAKEPWGWHPGTNATFEDGTKYSQPAEKCPYFIAYLKNISKNKTCGRCQFNKLPRQADLSIGDYWMVDKFNPAFNDKKGTSEILVNNARGAELLEKLRPEAQLLELASLDIALRGNPVMVQPYAMQRNRDYFFQNLDKMDFGKLATMCAQNTISSFNGSDNQMLEKFSSNLHGLYYLAKIVAQNYKGRKIVGWGNGPVFRGVLKKAFNLEVDFVVYADGRAVNGTTERSIEALRGNSSQYYVVSLLRDWSVQAEKILTDMGYQPEKDFIFRVHKAIVLENFDLSKGGYSDIYGNTISGSVGILKKVVFRGLNSHIALGKNVRTGGELEFDLGTNAKVTMGDGCWVSKNLKFESIGSNNPSRATVAIGPRCGFIDGVFRLYPHPQNSVITIGERCTFGSNLELHANSGKKLMIGKDCMFSHDVDVWAGDGHTIFDVTTGKNTNSDYDNLPAYKNEIVLGEHVWVSKGAFILTGTHIGNGSVVGAQSVVKGSFPNNCVVAGNPARDVKHNVAWSREMTATDMTRSVPQEYCALTQDLDAVKNRARSVLILGGTGRMSTKLTTLCVNNGDDVTIAVRGKHKASEEISAVKKLVFDRLDEKATREALQGKYYDIVFDCSGYVPQSVDWVLSSLKTKRYVYVSSIATYARYNRGVNKKEEDLSINTSQYEKYVAVGDKDWYARGKYSAERLIGDKYWHLSYVIVRIPFVMSLHDEDYSDALASRLMQYVSGVISTTPINEKNLDYRYNFVENGDEAKFLYFLSQNDFKGVINFASKGTISMREVINYVERKTGKTAVLSHDAPALPFTMHPEITLNIERCISLGYTPMHLDDWLYKKLDKYIDRCKK